MHRLLRSRLAVVLVFGVTLLALDVGRSIWARVALALPSAEYRPDPALCTNNSHLRKRGTWGRPPPDVPLRVVAFQRNPPNRRNAAPIHELAAPLKTRVELRCTLMGMCLRSLAHPAAKKDA
jgi:hypothetical protein